MATKIAILGTGTMGASAARCLAANEAFTVIAWNRTPARTVPLAEAGIKIASSPTEAVTVSDVVICLMSTYAVTREVLDEPSVTAALNGKTLIVLSNGTSRQVHGMANWLQDKNVAYLDGNIGGMAGDIGLPETHVTCAGDQQAWDRYQHVVKALGGASEWVSPNHASPTATNVGIVSIINGLAALFMDALVVATNEHVPAEQFAIIIKEHILPWIGSMLPVWAARVQQKQFDPVGPSDPPLTPGWLVELENVVQEHNDNGWDPLLSDALFTLFKRAGETGHGDESIIGLFNVIERAEKKKRKKEKDEE